MSIVAAKETFSGEEVTAVFVKVEPAAEGNLEKKGLPKPMIYSARDEN